MSISISDGQNIRKVSLSLNKKRFFHLFPKVPLRCLLFSVGVPKFPRSKLCKFNVGPWSCAKQFLCRRARLVAPVNPASKFIRWYFESICWFNYKLKRLVLDQCVDLKNCYFKKLFSSQDAFDEDASHGSHDLFPKFLHLKNYELSLNFIF